MPFVRIDLIEGKTPDYRAQVGQICVLRNDRNAGRSKG